LSHSVFPAERCASRE